MKTSKVANGSNLPMGGAMPWLIIGKFVTGFAISPRGRQLPLGAGFPPFA